jgi:hypothetical protein
MVGESRPEVKGFAGSIEFADYFHLLIKEEIGN